MKCALCQDREANKRNTHYLSDGIIRKCLNIGGTNERERGFYFDISNVIPFVEFNFQRIDEVNLEKALGRKPTEAELENARQIPFSVDFVFCNVCEKSFNDFEADFSSKIIPKLRNTDLSKIKSFKTNEITLIRMFCYIQIWRNSICEGTFKLNPDIKESLRQIILHQQIEDINKFPLSITYLETLGGDISFTENYVGSTNDKNPYIIFMNDFIIQFFDKEESIRFEEFYGLNNSDDFYEYLNIHETEFTIKIVHNAKRQELLKNIIQVEKVKQTLDFIESAFDLMWQRLFYSYPPIQIKRDYFNGLINGDCFIVLKYSKQQIADYTEQFILNRIRK